MIIEWHYGDNGYFNEFVKGHILKNKYTSIDIGASARYWSYPECKVIADANPVEHKDITYFKLNIEDASNWSIIYDYVKVNGKFDYSICSHTMEDVFNPIELANHLSNISKQGYVAIPSKFNEFNKLYGHKYRGNGHHKQFFDIINEKLIVFPKFNWIETDDRSDRILDNYKGSDLVFFWKDSIPIEIFGNGIPFMSDDSLINNYYSQLGIN